MGLHRSVLLQFQYSLILDFLYDFLLMIYQVSLLLGWRASHWSWGRQQVDAILLDFSKAFDKVPHSALQSSSITMASETKIYPGSRAFSRIEISKWPLMGRHHLVLLSHQEFHKAQCLDLSCSWYTSMTCSQELPLQYEFLLVTVYCTESYKGNQTFRHQISLDVSAPD